MSNPEFANVRTSRIRNSLAVFRPFLEFAKEELMIGILHPGGGQYDCLSLINATRPVLEMNLVGSAHVNGQAPFSLAEIWNRLELENAEEIGEYLFTQGRIEAAPKSRQRTPSLEMLDDMVKEFDDSSNHVVELLWGWFDSSTEGSLSKFPDFPDSFPSYWQDVQPVASQYFGWAANILQIEVDGEIIATYNQRLSEKLDRNNRLIRFSG